MVFLLFLSSKSFGQTFRGLLFTRSVSLYPFLNGPRQIRSFHSQNHDATTAYMRRSSHPISSALERRHTPLLASSGWKKIQCSRQQFQPSADVFAPTTSIHTQTHTVLLGIGRQTLHGFASAATLARGLEPVRSSALNRLIAPADT
jgi:hypothetical protein